jgi:hypothetical protein
MGPGRYLVLAFPLLVWILLARPQPQAYVRLRDVPDGALEG